MKKILFIAMIIFSITILQTNSIFKITLKEITSKFRYRTMPIP